jgi:hypothetical protein
MEAAEGSPRNAYREAAADTARKGRGQAGGFCALLRANPLAWNDSDFFTSARALEGPHAAL